MMMMIVMVICSNNCCLLTRKKNYRLRKKINLNINSKFDYTSDSVNRFKFFLRFSERKFDFTFHFDEASRSFIELMGIRLSGYQPLPVATQTWRPPSSPIPKKWDIVFLGRSTPHRERFFGPLLAGKKVQVLELSGDWADVRDPEVLAQLNAAK